MIRVRLSAVLVLLTAPALAEPDMVVRTQVSTLTVNGGAGTQFGSDCAPGETGISASFIAEEPIPATPTLFRKARGIFAEGWRTTRTGWMFDLVNYGARRDLRLTLSLVCFRGDVEEVRLEN